MAQNPTVIRLAEELEGYLWSVDPNPKAVGTLLQQAETLNDDEVMGVYLRLRASAKAPPLNAAGKARMREHISQHRGAVKAGALALRRAPGPIARRTVRKVQALIAQDLGLDQDGEEA